MFKQCNIIIKASNWIMFTFKRIECCSCHLEEHATSLMIYQLSVQSCYQRLLSVQMLLLPSINIAVDSCFIDNSMFKVHSYHNYRITITSILLDILISLVTASFDTLITRMIADHHIHHHVDFHHQRCQKI
jgi:hypothetical protein